VVLTPVACWANKRNEVPLTTIRNQVPFIKGGVAWLT
jgi:hypothetical protein